MVLIVGPRVLIVGPRVLIVGRLGGFESIEYPIKEPPTEDNASIVSFIAARLIGPVFLVVAVAADVYLMVAVAAGSYIVVGGLVGDGSIPNPLLSNSVE
jgi:hypothetical protein